MKHIAQPIPVILGPTASGKTAYAIALAEQIHGAIISADSRQVYTHMNIGTAKPQEAWAQEAHSAETPDIINGIPHYLLNIASIDQPYTLSDWLRDAKRTIDIVIQHNQTPIIAGGTMLYIDALTDGYDIPNIEPNEELRAELEKKSPEELYAMLIAQDSNASTFIEAHNSRRIIRALEVMSATGKKFSELRAKKSPGHEFTKIGIFSGWEQLKENITKRAQDMVDAGLHEEREKLEAAYPNSPLLKTMNYTETSVEEIVQSNMRYAHRQMSWWKRRSDIGWICL